MITGLKKRARLFAPTLDEKFRADYKSEASVQRLFEEQFGRERVEVESHGNVFTATSFLYGVGSEELTPEELNHRDPAYEVLITARVVSA